MASGAQIFAADGSTILDVSTFTSRLQGVLTITSFADTYIDVTIQGSQRPFGYAACPLGSYAYVFRDGSVSNRLRYVVEPAGGTVLIFYGAA
jgi:hypothetical protein